VITLIAQNPYHVQALEVLNTEGNWIRPEFEPEIFVVNLGDIMARFTNDTFLSTVHRVQNKNTEGQYSLVLFFGVKNDELVDVRPQFATPERPLVEGYDKGITAYEHFNIRLQSAHHQHPSSTGLSSAAITKGKTKLDGVLVEGL
jgi:isopenicillin N synthase-like dioxygenase